MITEKTFTKDLPLPPLEKGKLRLYSMRFCQFAHRSRLVLGHYGIPYETVNINFRSKPDWFLERNPNGKVPVYEKDGQVLYESAVVSDFIEDVYGTGELYPTDPFQRARAKLLMESASKVIGPFYQLYIRTKVDDPNLNENVEAYQKAIQFYEDQLENTFLTGASVGMADYYLWAHVEPMEALNEILGVDILPKDKFPKFNAWISTMKTTPGVKAAIFPVEIHKGFILTAKGGKSDYDYGL